MLDPKTKDKELFSQKADIETSSEDYARRFSGEVGEYFLSVQEEITLGLLKPWPKAKILDVGGGHAQLAVPLIKNGFNVTVAGSDESCRRRLDKFLQPGSFEYYTCNLLNLPFEDNSFEVAISFRLLTHEENWELQLSELCRVAKHTVIIDYPDTKSFNIFYDILFRVKKKFEGNTRVYRNFSSKEIIEEFRKNNFVNPVIKPEFFLPMVVHRAIKRVFILKNIENFFAMLGLTKLFGSPVILRVATRKETDRINLIE
jgi:ubiquinone/menaquinone biosynthesis C-methylase UbiE